MPPKVKITKEDIINAAVEIVRKSGDQAINARTVAAMLNCSTQPVFSNFATMEELRLAVVEQADAICGDYIQREIESGKFPSYKASGMAYIRFAQQERNLFRLLYMRDRTGETGDVGQALWAFGTELARQATGQDAGSTERFHMVMWALVHGFATMAATGYLALDEETVSTMLTDVFRRLRNDQD